MHYIIKNFILLIVLLMVAVTFTSCGRQVIEVEDSQQRVDGQIDIIIDWNLDALQEQFVNECEQSFDTQEEIDQCVEDKLSEFINLLDGLLNQNKGNNGQN